MLNEHTVYMTADQEVRARSGEMKRAEALSLLTEGLLPEIVLEAGDVVRFDGLNLYEIVRIEGDDMVVRRLNANNAGPAGETHVAQVSKYISHIRSGRAEVAA